MKTILLAWAVHAFTALGLIAAAGIAALIELYTIACQEGHQFCVLNPMPHVAKVLAVCGLDRFLMSHNVELDSYSGQQIELTAA